MSQLGTVKTVTMADGTTITIETGKLAKQADGSVVIRQGNCMVMANVVSAQEAREGVDFMPLTVEYQEKYAAAGRFPGGFFKREARPSEYEILIARLVDRALRPLFPDDYHADTQVIINLISADENVAPDALAAFAASSALAVSDIPFGGPISEVRVGRINGEFVVNPPISEFENSDLDMIIAATMDNVMMVEGEMKELSEAEMLEAIKVAHEAIKIQCQAQLDLAAELGKTEKREYNHETNDEEFFQRMHDTLYDKVYGEVSKAVADKNVRSESIKTIKTEFEESLSEEELEAYGEYISPYLHKIKKKASRRFTLDAQTRLDGRKYDEIRPIWCEVDYLPSAHGSGIFTRGETQSLTSVTLGTKLDEQTIDGVMFKGTTNFLLHYNFPPYSTGEARPLRSTSRREIGHGNLALRALKPMIPEGEDNPYTIRIVSEILESNGSSSMATVCAGTLALMDAGVKLKKPVSGIAMGLITDDDSDKFAVLSDILGDEDHLGDMDFKVTGTRDGITACQMDIKVDGLNYEVLQQALEQARAGRMHILDKLEETISTPREDYKPHVPRIVTIKIPKEFIGAVIGPGGKIIQEIQAITETTISIEEEGDWGIVEIAGQGKDAIDGALAKVKGITAQPEEGEEYEGTIKSIMPYGAFIEFLPGKQGLMHISEISWSRIEKMEDTGLNEGDTIKVKLVAVDPKTGKFKLSRKAMIPKPEQV